MSNLPTVLRPKDVVQLDMLAGLAWPAGDYVEVGVYLGGSAEILYRHARAQHRRLWLFDTFTGIPAADPIDKHGVGEFDAGGLSAIDALCRAMPGVVIVQGVFPDSLWHEPAGIAFAHIDCDQYRSVADCIEHLWPRVVPGGAMLSDDYPHLEGARLAVDEAFGSQVIVTGCGMALVVKPDA